MAIVAVVLGVLAAFASANAQQVHTSQPKSILAWAAEHGIRAENVTVADASRHGRTIRVESAHDGVGPNQAAIVIPESIVVTEHTLARGYPQLQQVIEAIYHESARCADNATHELSDFYHLVRADDKRSIALTIALHYRAFIQTKPSWLEKYFALLPPSLGHIPALYAGNEQQMLQGSPHLDSNVATEKSIERTVSNGILLRCIRDHPGMYGEGSSANLAETWTAIQWAHHTVRSRSVPLPYAGAGSALVPLLDALPDAADGGRVIFVFSQDRTDATVQLHRVEYHAKHHLPAGTLLSLDTLNGAQKCNHDILVQHGFVRKGNSSDCFVVTVVFNPPTTTRDVKVRQVLVNEKFISPQQQNDLLQVTIPVVNGQMISRELLSLLRLSGMSERELDAIIDARISVRMPFTLTSEHGALQALHDKVNRIRAMAQAAAADWVARGFVKIPDSANSINVQNVLEVNRGIIRAADHAIQQLEEQWMSVFQSAVGGWTFNGYTVPLILDTRATEAEAVQIGDIPEVRSIREYLHDQLSHIMMAHLHDNDHVESHTGDSAQETYAMSRIALETNPRTICEVGFNAGHGAASMIVAAPNLQTYVAFDIGEHGYTVPAAQFLNSTLQSLGSDAQIHIILGDSTQTVPSFLTQRGSPQCDLVFIDGGHYGDVPAADLRNMAMLAAPNATVVIDDATDECVKLREPGYGCYTPTRAWKAAVRSGMIEETRCLTFARTRGICIGRYIKPILHSVATNASTPLVAHAQSGDIVTTIANDNMAYIHTDPQTAANMRSHVPK